ncbi:MAG: hypothetical protein ACRC68_04445 [Clostridium sp.]
MDIIIDRVAYTKNGFTGELIMWNLLNKNRCETMSDLFRDSIKFEKEWCDAIVKILLSDYKDALETGDLMKK